jgi:hypothetical protein
VHDLQAGADRQRQQAFFGRLSDLGQRDRHLGRDGQPSVLASAFRV